MWCTGKLWRQGKYVDVTRESGRVPNDQSLRRNGSGLEKMEISNFPLKRVTALTSNALGQLKRPKTATEDSGLRNRNLKRLS